ncbi:hypothetical protein G9A89_007233 [Geosiphon pyriformis]|nr:hypothetical protein G9A89_007233 [Geosiphon pyriformis]
MIFRCSTFPISKILIARWTKHNSRKSTQRTSGSSSYLQINSDHKRDILTDVRKAKKNQKWTEVETKELIEAVGKHGRKWGYLQKSLFPHRGVTALVHKYDEKVFQVRLKGDNGQQVYGFGPVNIVPAGSWTSEESKELLEAVQKYGKKWTLISQKVFNLQRSALGCRSKYFFMKRKENTLFSKNYLRWTEIEQVKLEMGVQEHGWNWKLISRQYFNSERSPNALMEKYRRLGLKGKWMNKILNQQELKNPFQINFDFKSSKLRNSEIGKSFIY